MVAKTHSMTIIYGLTALLLLAACSSEEVRVNQGPDVVSIRVKCLDEKWILDGYDGAILRPNEGQYFRTSATGPKISGPTDPPRDITELVGLLQVEMAKKYSSGVAKDAVVDRPRDDGDEKWKGFPPYIVTVELRMDERVITYVFQCDKKTDGGNVEALKFDSPEAKLFNQLFFRLYSFQVVNESRPKK